MKLNIATMLAVATIAALGILTAGSAHAAFGVIDPSALAGLAPFAAVGAGGIARLAASTIGPRIFFDKPNDGTGGDVVDVTAVEFIDGLDGEVIQQPGMFDAISSHAGTLINAAAFIVVVFLVAFFGLRPMAAALAPKATPAIAGPSFDDVQRSLPTPDVTAAVEGPTGVAGALPGTGARPTPLDDLRQKIRPAPQERLARMVDLNEERTAQILRKWAAAQELAG